MKRILLLLIITMVPITAFCAGSIQRVSATGTSMDVILSSTLSSYEDQSTKQTVGNESDFRQSFFENGHSCVILIDRTVKCWGDNTYGQLGDGTVKSSLTPVTVLDLTNVRQIALGGFHTCALLIDNTVKCWGGNWFGQLGNDKVSYSSIPVVISALTNLQVVEIYLGDLYTCVVLDSDDAFLPPREVTLSSNEMCWGVTLD